MGKQIANFVITGIVLYFATKFFPAYVQIDNRRTLILASILLFFAEILAMISILIMGLTSLFTFDWLGAIISMVIGVFFGEIIAISLVTAWLPGFVVNGLTAKFLLAIALSIFRIPNNNNNN